VTTFRISMLQAHGGEVTHDFEMAHFAVVSKAMSNKQLEIVKRPNSTTTTISGAWINESIKNGAQLDQDDFLIPKLRTIDTSDRPLTNSESPSPSTRAQDENYFLWACEKLFNENTLIQWMEIYRWCANDVGVTLLQCDLFSTPFPHRPNADLNHTGLASMHLEV
jgi:hypothetical protein